MSDTRFYSVGQQKGFRANGALAQRPTPYKYLSTEEGKSISKYLTYLSDLGDRFDTPLCRTKVGMCLGHRGNRELSVLGMRSAMHPGNIPHS